MPKKGYKQTEDHKRKAGEAKKGHVTWNKGMTGLPPTKGFKGRKHSDETKKKMSESAKISQLGNSNGFKGGSIDYLHEKAWRLFGDKTCSECFITNSEHMKKYGCRLNMHCTSNPKDYTLMIESNWITYCKDCHGQVDNGNLTST